MRNTLPSSRRIQTDVDFAKGTPPFWGSDFLRLRLLPGGTPCGLLNIQTRSIPLHDVAVCIVKWHFPVEHPTVFSVCSTDACFILEDFCSRERHANSPQCLERPQGERKPSTSTRSHRPECPPGIPTKAYSVTTKVNT